MDENKTPAQQAPDTAAPETTNIEQTTQPETAPAPEGTEAPKAPEAPETAAPAQKAEHGARWRHALWRGIAGVLAAVVLLAASGFGVFRIAKGAQSIEGTFDADPGTFVQHDIIFILDTFEDPAGGSAQYAVVPIGGQLVAFRFPARWDASVKTIADATTSVLQGQSYSIDSFIRVTGTVKAMPEAVSSEIYSWYTDNHDYLQKIGAIGDSDDAALPARRHCARGLRRRHPAGLGRGADGHRRRLPDLRHRGAHPHPLRQVRAGKAAGHHLRTRGHDARDGRCPGGGCCA